MGGALPHRRFHGLDVGPYIGGGPPPVGRHLLHNGRAYNGPVRQRGHLPGLVGGGDVRGSESSPARLDTPIYRDLYAPYDICDTMTLNLTYDHQVMALLTLYRTQAEGDFTEEEAFPSAPSPTI